MKGVVAEAAAERLVGQRPSRTRALVAATVAASVVGAVTYKLLRWGDHGERGSGNGQG